MFANEMTAATVREHIANVIYILSASSHQSPVSEATVIEQRAYKERISQICLELTTKIIDPIEAKHPNLSKLSHVYYKESTRKRKRTKNINFEP